MALISCPECGKEISDKVKACPHCGCPIESQIDSVAEPAQEKPKSGFWKKALIFVLIIFAICFIASRLNPSGGGGEKLAGELEAVTFAQITVREFYPNAELAAGTRNYTVVATGLRYKVEGEATINGIATDFIVIIEFDSDEYNAYTIETVEIGGQRLA